VGHNVGSSGLRGGTIRSGADAGFSKGAVYGERVERELMYMGRSLELMGTGESGGVKTLKLKAVFIQKSRKVKERKGKLTFCRVSVVHVYLCVNGCRVQASASPYIRSMGAAARYTPVYYMYVILVI